MRPQQQQQKHQQRRRISVSSSSTLFLLSLFGIWLLSSTTSVWTANALAPPHPEEFAEYEPLLKYRKRMNITFNYEPKHITQEHCRYLNETACQEWDEMVGEQISPHHKRRRLNPNKGKFKILVILIYFPEHKAQVGTTLPPKEHFEALYNGVGTSETNPVGGIAEWLRYNSYTQYDVEFDIQDWQETNGTEAGYAAGKSGRLNSRTMAGVFVHVLEKMDAAGFNFAQYDADSDGSMDSMIAIHSGFPAERGNPTCAPPNTDRIWSQGTTGAGGAWSSKSGTALNGYMLASAYMAPGCTTPTAMAIHAHEFIHTFDARDLYDFDIDEGTFGIAGVGSFDIMANAYGWKSNSNLPGFLGPYSRFATGWQEAIEITEPGFYTVQPGELSTQVYKITHNFPVGEYLLIENRFALKWASDWAGKGIVIWHIDEVAPLQSNRGYPGDGRWPSEHYRVSVLQADGRYDIEQLVNLGDADDFWTKDDTLGPGPDTWPNTDSIQFEQKQTGVTIKVMTDASFIMQFQVIW